MRIHPLLIAGTLGLMASTAIAADGGRPLTTSLSGAAEPGGGDADGAGMATVRINPGQGQLCFELSATNIDAATAAHVHVGAAGVNGAVVVPLTAPTSGTSSGCVSIARDLATKIIRSPSNYYVNVHNAAYPNGAIRGQLSK